MSSTFLMDWVLYQ